MTLSHTYTMPLRSHTLSCLICPMTLLSLSQSPKYHFLQISVLSHDLSPSCPRPPTGGNIPFQSYSANPSLCPELQSKLSKPQIGTCTRMLFGLPGIQPPFLLWETSNS